jgi:hypothetical protein
MMIRSATVTQRSNASFQALPRRIRTITPFAEICTHSRLDFLGLRLFGHMEWTSMAGREACASTATQKTKQGFTGYLLTASEYLS